MRAWSPRAITPGLASGVLPAVVVAVLQVIGSGLSLDDDFSITFSSTGVARWLPSPGELSLLLAGCMTLVFRQVVPFTVFALTATAALIYQMRYGPGPLPLAVLVALYTVAVARRPLIASGAAALYLVALTFGALTGRMPITDDLYYTYLVSVVATVMLGYGVALGRAGASLAEQRAATLARDQEARTRAAVEQEQSRIAREVHDIVAHDVSVMVAQARAGRRVFESRPATAAEALTSIETVGRDALEGLRRLMTLLRTDLEQAERSPPPSLERLPWLLTHVQRAGLPVDLTVRGRARPLSATVELSAFRIVQEALTNVLKHAGPTRASVVLEYEEDRIHIEVRDWGRGGGQRRSNGYGLISMQQRAALLGGELWAGPAVDHGFVVSAWLPLHDADTNTDTDTDAAADSGRAADPPETLVAAVSDSPTAPAGGDVR